MIELSRFESCNACKVRMDRLPEDLIQWVTNEGRYLDHLVMLHRHIWTYPHATFSITYELLVCPTCGSVWELRTDHGPDSHDWYLKPVWGPIIETPEQIAKALQKDKGTKG